MATATASIPATTRMGPVSLSVGDLDRSLSYYGDHVGLALLGRQDGRASLGAGGTELLALAEEPGARAAGRYTGLYHFALRVPERADLARWLAHAARERVPLVGLSDHFVSEAIYLVDPDGHGIEIYHDRPRELWEGQVAVRLVTDPLDVGALLAELDDPATEPFTGLPAGTDMGHVHLQVADVAETLGFYRDVLGFELMAEIPGSAVFLAVGGYHHHVGANTWHSRGAAPAPEGTARLLHATVVLPDAEARDRVAARVEAVGGKPEQRDEGGVLVRDPSGIGLLLITAS
jgi:catechol 2,3-dioxygenase